jgi:hypothetical protein
MSDNYNTRLAMSIGPISSSLSIFLSHFYLLLFPHISHLAFTLYLLPVFLCRGGGLSPPGKTLNRGIVSRRNLDEVGNPVLSDEDGSNIQTEVEERKYW